MCIGGSVAPPPAKTADEIAAETDNEYINPDSGESTPDWKGGGDKTKDDLTVPDDTKPGQGSDLHG